MVLWMCICCYCKVLDLALCNIVLCCGRTVLWNALITSLSRSLKQCTSTLSVCFLTDCKRLGFVWKVAVGKKTQLNTGCCDGF